jgi:hypothetical protein
MTRSGRTAAAIALVLAGGGALLAGTHQREQEPERFPHQRHATMFPLCTTCHLGVVQTGAPLFPEPAACTSCHDGTVAPVIDWQLPTAPRRSNLRFTHERHERAVQAHQPGDTAMSIARCTNCHVPAGEHRMTVRHAVVGQCLDCHGLAPPHVDVAARECATCHFPLAAAPTLTAADIRDFPRPRSHDAPDFRLGGHGRLAREPAHHPEVPGIAASCATCHSRNLCVACHVNVETPVIAALPFDDRSPVFALTQPVPESHHDPLFVRTHGRLAMQSPASCATCHTRESCQTCHVEPVPRVVRALSPAAPGRAVGAQLVRTPPPDHTADFRERHGPQASARPQSCAMCHTRSSCLDCHRPDVDRQPRYHAGNFLVRHPSEAYSRAASCSDCHNPAQFCQSCHVQSGLVAARRIGPAGYHDVFRGFSLGHGQAARQSLESCASCHAERDCTACHSAVAGGFRFNPHGPGFNAARMRSKNPSLCTACHGTAVPAG